MTAVEVADLTFTYRDGDEPALRSVSCTVGSGEFVGVTGPTGAGKSTFCRLLPGFVPNFFPGELHGTVRVGDRVPVESGIGALGKTVGAVFENPRDQLTGAATTVLEEVAFGLEQRGVEHDAMRRRARTALDRVGVAHLADRSPNALSGGQLQRVALASVLALDPAVLVLDEPTAQLDPEGAAEVFDVVSRLCNEGRTVVLASHRLGRLAPAADRLFVLDDGRLAQTGTPRAVLAADDAAELVRLPEPVRLGRRLRDQGVVPPDSPLPLTEAEVVAEAERVVDATTGQPSDGASEARDGEATTPDRRPRREGDSRGGDAERDGESGQLAGRNVEHDGGGAARVRVEEVNHRCGDVEALSDVSLALDAGCVALVGHNGAGKTTLAKHLNGLLTPDAGRVLIGGTDTRETTAADLAATVGLAFQAPEDQLFRPTVAEEVRFGPENLGLVDGDRAVTAALERVGLADEAATDTYELGRPARKRVALASVLATRPEVLVLDEPTAGQDRDGVRVVGNVVEEAVDDGRLVVCVTHDVAFACAYADRVVAMADGAVVADGPPAAVFGDPAVCEAAGLRPSVAMAVGEALGFDGCVTVDGVAQALSD